MSLRQQLDEAQTILQKNPDLLSPSLFPWVCEEGHLELANYLYTLQKTNEVQIQNAFHGACEYGHLAIVEWLYTCTPTPIISDYAFYQACEYGHLEVAQKLFEWNPHLCIEKALAYTCVNGHLEVVQQLVEWNPDIIEKVGEFIFGATCQYGHLHIAKWLLKKKPNLDIRENNDYAIRYANYFGQFETVQWLQSLRPDIYTVEESEGTIVCLQIGKKKMK